MTIALVLILGAMLVAWTAPRLLEYRLHTGADPQTLLVTWIALVGGTLWLDLPQPMAYSLTGRPALIVASEGLRRQLPATRSRPSSSTSGPTCAAATT